MVANKQKNGFFEQVYSIVAKIPNGKVASYGQIATLLNAPRAARTVGWALNSLPQNLDIPWHRVINSQGKISYNCRGYEADLQRNLLEAEGIIFDLSGKTDMEKFQWKPEKSYK